MCFLKFLLTPNQNLKLIAAIHIRRQHFLRRQRKPEDGEKVRFLDQTTTGVQKQPVLLRHRLSGATNDLLPWWKDRRGGKEL